MTSSIDRRLGRVVATVALSLVAVVVPGCATGDDDDGGATKTVTEVVVTDKATGKPAAEVEAERASRIKTRIDSSAVVRLFPPTIVLDGDISAMPKASPGRALLEWWQAFQFRDPKTVLELTSRATREAIGRRDLTTLVRLTGLPGLSVLDTTTDGETALIQAALLNFNPPSKGAPPPREPTGSQAVTFTMTRESGKWRFDEPNFLVPKVNNLKK